MFKIMTNRGEVFNSDGKNILQVLQSSEIYLPASCGGKGICGRCKIRIIDGKVKSRSFLGISEEERKRGYVLACKSYPESDVLIELPQKLITVSERISIARIELIEQLFKEAPSLLDPLFKKVNLNLSPPTIEDSQADFERLQHALGRRLSISRQLASKISDFFREKNWQISIVISENSKAFSEDKFSAEQNEIIDLIEPSTKLYGVSVDIGTTTVALALIDIENKRVIDITSCYNSQVSYGDDVITRIIYTEENPQGLAILRKCIVDDINALINTVSIRHGNGKILFVTVAGNTTMSHIFWGINPEYIRHEPYTPALNHYPVWKSSDAELLLESQVPVYTLPCVAGYVGGDVVAGVLASGIYKDEKVSLFIDIGTNGEIVIGNREWLVTASTSAGPCFEGSGISCGIRATEGAVEAFNYHKETDSFEVKIIGNVKPSGICGSGMIDIVAELFSKGIIDRRGKLILGSSKWIKLFDEPRFLISEDCYITQSDIDNIIRAKAALYAGVSTLVGEVGITEKDIAKIYIAGGFGEFLDIRKAIKIGMLPALPEERFIFLGNTSLAGAILCLLSNPLRQKVEELAEYMTYIDLSSSKRFMDEYVSALFIPHTDFKRFPDMIK
ncbi:ASKHA domain-containing protein [Thermodesulfovibrio thiophilus]|uniref:ASKHA domain-containing protein n=1 Tax=Thermodesulfovibrio thiophilus TaxID=340095 RepID=UPI0009FD2D5F|nr:ASKHA domain-containing protein [Thermodesulfovibrio thiophilus]